MWRGNDACVFQQGRRQNECHSSVQKTLIALTRGFHGNPQLWLVIGAIAFLLLQIVIALMAASLVRSGSADKSQQILDLLTGSTVVSFAFTMVAFLACMQINRIIRKISDSSRSFLQQHGEYQQRRDLAGFDELARATKQVASVASAVSEREAAIANHSLDLLLSMTSGGQIIAVNDASLRHVGQHPYQVLYKHISALIQPEDIEVFQQAMVHARNGPMEVAAGVNLPDGEQRIFLWTVEFSSTHQTYFCAGKDVTEKMQLERFKQDFTSMVVHDLRSPISSSVMTIQMVISDGWEPLADSHRMHLSRCLRGLHRLLSLVNSLLDLNKLAAGKFKLQIELVRLSRIVDESISTVSPYAQHNQVTIKTAGSLDEKVAADEERIVQVLVNLLTNAIKYSPESGTVTISAYKGERLITIIVADEGPGIPEEHRPRIFERYQQVGEGEQPGTTGLGLFICKAIVQRHGGNIGVRSEGGKGSQFWFTLPGLSTQADPDLDL